MNTEPSLQDRQLQRLLISREGCYDENTRLRSKLFWWRIYAVVGWALAIAAIVWGFRAVGSSNETPGPTAFLFSTAHSGQGLGRVKTRDDHLKMDASVKSRMGSAWLTSAVDSFLSAIGRKPQCTPHGCGRTLIYENQT